MEALRDAVTALGKPVVVVELNGRPAVVENNHEQRMQAALKHLQTAARIELDATLAAWERSYIEAALELCAGNVSCAARRLGINRTTLYNRMESWHRS